MRAPLIDWLTGAPWLSAAELAALCGGRARTVRHRLAGLVAAARARGRRRGRALADRGALRARRPGRPAAGPAGWSAWSTRAPCTPCWPAGRAGRAAARRPVAGEAGGPPAGRRAPPAGRPRRRLAGPRRSRRPACSLRWDDGERRDAAERAWLAALLALAPYAPPVALVCADDAGRPPGSTGWPACRAAAAAADDGGGARSARPARHAPIDCSTARRGAPPPASRRCRPGCWRRRPPRRAAWPGWPRCAWRSARPTWPPSARRPPPAADGRRPGLVPRRGSPARLRPGRPPG